MKKLRVAWTRGAHFVFASRIANIKLVRVSL